jgi:SAM-dependent methyltransferase
MPDALPLSPPAQPHRSPDDTAAQLQAAYAPAGGPAAIFSRKVADYVASRPDYPAALFACLDAAAPAGPPGQPAPLWLDVGAGTGLLTRGLLALGRPVLAVEPSDEMRAAADQALGALPGYRSAAGRAEALPVPDACAGMITAAQAFHWFDIPKARAECQRVLAPGGQVALIWNDRVPGDPLHQALDEVFARHGGAQRGALVAHEERLHVGAFYGTAAVQVQHWPHAHPLSEDGLARLVFSRSYMPAADSPAGQQARAELREIFRALAAGQPEVVVRYTTVLYLGRPA